MIHAVPSAATPMSIAVSPAICVHVVPMHCQTAPVSLITQTFAAPLIRGPTAMRVPSPDRLSHCDVASFHSKTADPPLGDATIQTSPPGPTPMSAALWPPSGVHAVRPKCQFPLESSYG